MVGPTYFYVRPGLYVIYNFKSDIEGLEEKKVSSLHLFLGVLGEESQNI